MASRVAGFVSAGVLALHLAAGIAALALLPRGFAVDDIHLWSNTIIPAIASLAVAAALISWVFWRWSARVVSILIGAAAGGWISAVVTGAVLFPSSMTLARIAVPAVVALLLVALAWWSSERKLRSLVALLTGAGLGAVEILAQRAPLPSTRPAGGTLVDVRGEPSNEDVSVSQITAPCGNNRLRLYPLLTFLSRSPDRTWSLLSPDEPGARRELSHFVKTPSGFRAAFIDDGESTLVAAGDDNGLDLEAVSKLDSPVYSHLNAFTTIEVPFDATLSFSPTASTRFPIEPADYPSGRPARLAYLDAALAFHVVRADDAEKGPFSELAEGQLGRGEPLILELRPRNDSDSGCRLIFKDWSSQVSTEPSPTAGWGVPQNSIQFFSRGGPGVVVLTLAETGPGRGFDTVGHAAGTYRNRLRVEPIRTADK
jgi:hypothetical protein